MAKKEMAQFGLGCFWHPDDYFSKLEGVLETRVGYEDGEKEDPTYEDLGEHTETTEISFDPDKISYRDLLKHFFAQHDPTLALKQQYKSVIFPTNDSQRKEAEEVVAEEKKLRPKLQTEIRQAEKFTIAEEYHQKYLAKQRGEL